MRNRPIMIMGILILICGVYLAIDGFTGGWLVGVANGTGIAFIIVDLEFKKLKDQLAKPASAPPTTEEV